MKCRVIRIVSANLCCMIIFLWSSSLEAQAPKDIRSKLAIPDTNQVQILKTTDGSTLMGQIVEIGDAEIQFETKLGRITVPIARIEDVTTTAGESVKDGKVWFPNPNQTRLYFSPTGRMLKKGSGFFTDIYVFFPGFAYGITDNFSIGGGMSLIPGISLGDQIFYFTPKVGFQPTENLALALGALILAIPNLDFDSDDTPRGRHFLCGGHVRFSGQKSYNRNRLWLRRHRVGG